MIDFPLRLRQPRGPTCDCCECPIEVGEYYYDLPGGLQVCADSDCLNDWALPYRRTRQPAQDEEE